MDTEIYDVVGFAKELELECEYITDLYISYMDEIKEHSDRLKETFDKKDFIELEHAVHNVKGLAANLWINDVFEEASILNKLLKENNYENLEEHLDKLINSIFNSKNKIYKSFTELHILL